MHRSSQQSLSFTYSHQNPKWNSLLTYIHIISSWRKHSNNKLYTMPFCALTHTIFSTQYKSQSPSLLSFLQPHVTSALFNLNIFLSVPFLIYLGLHFFSTYENKFPTHKLLDSKQKDKRCSNKWEHRTESGHKIFHECKIFWPEWKHILYSKQK